MGRSSSGVRAASDCTIGSQAEAEAYLSPEKAEEARQEGNEFFKRGPAEGPEMYAKASETYSEALRRNPKDHVPNTGS